MSFKYFNSLHSILDYFDGKKTFILAVSNPIITFLMSRNIIANDTGILFSTILGILGGGAAFATVKLAAGRAKGTIPPKNT